MRARALFAGLLVVPLLLVGALPAAAADSTTISAPVAAVRGSDFYLYPGYSVDPIVGGATLQLLVTLVGAGANGSLALPNSPVPPAEVTNCTPGSSPAGDPRLTCDWAVPDNAAAAVDLKVLATVNSGAPLGTWTAVSVLQTQAPLLLARAEKAVQIVDGDKVTVTAPATAAQGASLNGTVDLLAAALPGSGDQSLPLSISLVGAGANGSLAVPTSLPAGVAGCAVDTNPLGDPRLRCTYTVPVDAGGSATLTVPVGIGSAATVGSTFVLRAGLGETPVTGEAPITVTAASSPSPTASATPTASASPTASPSPTSTPKPTATQEPDEAEVDALPTAVPAGEGPAERGSGLPVGPIAAVVLGLVGAGSLRAWRSRRVG